MAIPAATHEKVGFDCRSIFPKNNFEPFLRHSLVNQLIESINCNLNSSDIKDRVTLVLLQINSEKIIDFLELFLFVLK